MSQANISPMSVSQAVQPARLFSQGSQVCPLPETSTDRSVPVVPTPDTSDIADAVVDASHSGSRLWEALFKNLDYNFDAVYTVVDAVLTTKDRCQITPLYIQGVVTSSATFLVSNVGNASQLHLTDVDTCWRVGRALDCALRIDHPAIDSCQAAIDYAADTGFCIADLGSTTGLRHNRHRLPSLGKRQLRDGDLLEMGTLRIEFFIDDFTHAKSDISGTYF